MSYGVLVPIASRNIQKRYHLIAGDIVYLATDTMRLLRAIININKGKGRYIMAVLDKDVENAKTLELRPVKITEKVLLRLGFFKEEVENNICYILYDMSWEPKIGISLKEMDNGEKTYHIVIGANFSNAFLEYTGCKGNIDKLNEADAMEKTRVVYVHDIQHLFSRITGYELPLMWDVLSEEYDDWYNEIDTLYLNVKDECGVCFNDELTAVVILITDKNIENFFWIPDLVSKEKFLAKILFEDYGVNRLNTSCIYQKRYKNLSITRNGNTLIKKIKNISVNPPVPTVTSANKAVNYICIDIDDNVFGSDNKSIEWEKLSLNNVGEIVAR